tara:strand:+ start:1838 stop:3013 length:1176 start_codon:yes stop_codon:yes gene_type:complete
MRNKLEKNVLFMKYLLLIFVVIFISSCANMSTTYDDFKSRLSSDNFLNNNSNPKTINYEAIVLPELSNKPILVEDINIQLIDSLDEKNNLNIPVELISYRPGPYKIGIGDKLLIYVYGETERLSAVIAFGKAINPIYEKYVRDDGTIFYPNAGILKADGKTVEELRKDLTLKLSTVLKDPQIDVSITEYNSQKIIVSGVFESPGSYSIETVPKTLAQVISTANPIQNNFSDYERGDLTSLKLTRDGSIYDIDYEYLSRNSQLLNNIYLKNGDVIHLSDSSLMNVFVLGEAQEPKTIRINRRNLPLSSVLGQAKGLDNAYSKNSSVYIFRPSDAENQPRIFRIDMTSPSGYLLADKFEVHSRDIVYIGTKNVTNWSRIFRQLIPIKSIISST